MVLKAFLKKIIPKPIMQFRREFLREQRKKIYEGLTNKQIFEQIYKDNTWDKSRDTPNRFYSGSGSHSNIIVEPYISAISEFINSFSEKPNVVDLGCGDFNVGSRIRFLCSNYIACDIVEPLIEHDKEKYKDLKVDFRVLSITDDELPEGDIAFVRQVLQHLSNEDIGHFIKNIKRKYKYLIVTEHLPNDDSFTPNVENYSGPDTRLDFNSGVLLTEEPFNLAVLAERCLCLVSLDKGNSILRTDLYKLK